MRYLFILVCLVTSITLQAQHKVVGTVKDTSGRPLNGATVQADGGKQSAVSDELGTFQLERMPEGNHTLLVRFLGFADYRLTITVPVSEPLVIVLEETSTVTDEVIVQATRASESTPTTYVNVGRQVLQKQNFGQDLPLLLNWTPSVVTTSDAGAGVGAATARATPRRSTRSDASPRRVPRSAGPRGVARAAFLPV